MRETAGAILLEYRGQCAMITPSLRAGRLTQIYHGTRSEISRDRRVFLRIISNCNSEVSGFSSWNRSGGLMLDDLVTSFANNATTSFNGSVEFMLEYSWVHVVISYENTFSVNERQMAFSQRGRNYVFSTKVSKFSKY